MSNDANPDDNVVVLECDHCGDVAIGSDTGEFFDGEGSACMTCGFPGQVSVGESDDDDIAFANWNCNDHCEIGEPIPVCNDLNCEDCKEWRGKIHEKGDGYGF